jgi:hypothetical protein
MDGLQLVRLSDSKLGLFRRMEAEQVAEDHETPGLNLWMTTNHTRI